MNRDFDRQADELSGDAERLAPLLRRLLEELDVIERRTVVGGASRRLIQYGRSLDSLLWQAHRQWKEYNREADAGTLDELCRTLIAAHDDAEQLKVALEVTSAPLASSETDTQAGPDIRDLLSTLEQRLSGAEGAPEPSVDRSSVAELEPRPPATDEPVVDSSALDSSALEGMLWRITNDWQHLQQAPSPDRIALLCDKLERASDEVRRLAEDIENASRLTMPEIAAESSPPSHPPFRDPMTGSLSREGFDMLVIGELKRSRRYRRPFTLLVVEVRDGDSRAMAEALEQLTVGLRGSDFVGTYVDRMIAVGLPETSSEAALVAARRVMRSMPAGGAGETGPKFGLASLPEDGRTLAELAALARRRLRDGPVSLGDSGNDYWGV